MSGLAASRLVSIYPNLLFSCITKTPQKKLGSFGLNFTQPSCSHPISFSFLASLEDFYFLLFLLPLLEVKLGTEHTSENKIINKISKSLARLFKKLF